MKKERVNLTLQAALVWSPSHSLTLNSREQCNGQWIAGSSVLALFCSIQWVLCGGECRWRNAKGITLLQKGRSHFWWSQQRSKNDLIPWYIFTCGDCRYINKKMTYSHNCTATIETIMALTDFGCNIDCDSSVPFRPAPNWERSSRLIILGTD